MTTFKVTYYTEDPSFGIPPDAGKVEKEITVDFIKAEEGCLRFRKYFDGGKENDIRDVLIIPIKQLVVVEMQDTTTEKG